MAENPSPQTLARGAAFGEFLRASRERRGVSLQQIAHETKIGQRHLAALERGDVRFWPNGMYRRAMMRAYAEAVGLDAEQTVQEFVRVFSASDAAAQTPVPLVGRSSRTHVPWPGVRFVLLALAFVAVVLGAAFSVSRDGSGASSQPLAAPGEPPQPSNMPGVLAAAEKSTATAGVGDMSVEGADLVEGELRVISDPEGARVTVNGIGWGVTPITIRYLPLGEKRVRLIKEGFLSGERIVHLDGDRPTRAVRVTLRPMPEEP